jgi:hypothetical protein
VNEHLDTKSYTVGGVTVQLHTSYRLVALDIGDGSATISRRFTPEMHCIWDRADFNYSPDNGGKDNTSGDYRDLNPGPLVGDTLSNRRLNL